MNWHKVGIVLFEGISMAELSRRTGIDRKTLTHYAKSANTTPIGRVAQICKARGMSMEELLHEAS